MSATTDPQRRALLGLFGAALSSLAVPALAGERAKPEVVVVGGGYGGATAAKYLRLWSRGAVDVTLVEQNPDFVSCPVSNLVVAGRLPLAAITQSYQVLERRWGVRVIHARADAVDHDRRQLRLAGGARLPYDRLVLSPGIDFQWDRIPGLASDEARARYPHAWKAGPQTLLLRRQLQAMRPGGVFAISIPRSPFRCPPGPYERACVVAAWCRQHNPRAKVLILDANPDVQSKRDFFRQAWQEHYPGLVEYHPGSELEDVNDRTAILEFDRVDFDVLNLIPPQQAGAIAHQAGLQLSNGRWVTVGWPGLESVSHPGVHVLGDAIFPAPYMPKSGHMANQHGKLAAAAILTSLAGLPPNLDAVASNTCYSYLTFDQVVHISSMHRYDPATQTMEPVKGAGGLSAAPNREEVQMAHAWATNIWADMLG